VDETARSSAAETADLEEFLKKPIFHWKVKEAYYTYKKDMETGGKPIRGNGVGQDRVF